LPTITATASPVSVVSGEWSIDVRMV
jgi:hypothetical protein